jgi:2,4-dienoyl-CoA reductase-like NADH-dependent reductase (Old Yellow Enzyme family)
MSAPHLTHVLTPIRIGPAEIKNRVVRPAHGTGLGRMGNVTEELIAYHEARARGGVGLTIIEIMGVHPSGPGPLNAFNPRLEETYPRLTERLHRHGMKVFQQLWHAGHNVMPMNGGPPWSASDIPGTGVGVVPVPMTKAMIDEVIEAYATAARNLERWGADGVEVHCAHGYLPGQFLSLNCNKRQDEYGGSFENRARFMLEAVAAVRAAVSSNCAVGVRVSADVIVNGVDPDDLIRATGMLEARGLIDYCNVSQGNYQSVRKIIGGMHEPTGYELETSTPVTHSLKVPTIVVGRFRTLEEVDQAIRNGDCDLVAMNRATIADPDLVSKTAAGHPEQVRPCIGCNQGCIGGELGGGGIGCSVNAGAGRELQRGDHRLEPAQGPRRVLVVGGGPAGMEAARVAALRGHQVTLAEAGPRLGGAINLAAMAPTRAGMRDVTVWLESEIYRLGVEVRLNAYMDVDDIVAEGANAVIVATGASPRMDGVQLSNPGEPIAGVDQPHVISSNGLFEGVRKDLGKTAVVIDDMGHYEGVATADYLLSRGLDVTYVTRHATLAPRIGPFLMIDAALQRMDKGHFRQRLRTRAIAIDEDGVTVAPVYAAEGSNVGEKLAADTVVLISLNRPNRGLYDELVARGVEARVVGDSNTPRFLTFATRDGHLAGASV